MILFSHSNARCLDKVELYIKGKGKFVRGLNYHIMKTYGGVEV